MGQLERYGLYVLCLVIFLILGVAIWGSDPQELNHNRELNDPAAVPVVKSEEDHLRDIEGFMEAQARNTLEKQKSAESAIFKPAEFSLTAANAARRFAFFRRSARRFLFSRRLSRRSAVLRSRLSPAETTVSNDSFEPDSAATS